MNDNLIAESTPLTADQWAQRWQQEADARNADFKRLSARIAKLEQELQEAKNTIIRVRMEKKARILELKKLIP